VKLAYNLFVTPDLMFTPCKYINTSYGTSVLWKTIDVYNFPRCNIIARDNWDKIAKSPKVEISLRGDDYDL